MRLPRTLLSVLGWLSTVLVLAGGPDEAQAQCQANELAKLTASDATGNEEFGRCVSIDGNVAVSGVRLDSVDYTWTGSVYVYEFDGVNWNEVAKLIASDRAYDDQLGLQVAISGDVVVAGAWHDDDNGSNSGSAYVFVKPPGGWTDMTETAKLTASDGAPEDYLGQAVAISGDVAVIGATGDDDAGSAYVFVKPPEGWTDMTETGKLTASDGAPADNFSDYAAAIDGDVVVIGVAADDDAGTHSGSAYLFVKPPGGWVTMTETAKLTASDAAAEDYFGVSVGVSGDVALVGAYGDDDMGLDSGSVYVFVRPPDGWADMTETGKLTAADGAPEEHFGGRVSKDGDVAVIAARGDDDAASNAGSAYVFRFDGTNWIEQAKLIASDADVDDWLGASVSVSADRALVGTEWDDDAGSKSGSAYVFHGISDCNNNGVLDICDIVDGTSGDCNDNGVPDECDISSGESADCNGNGIPDECDLAGDIDGDGDVDLADLAALLANYGRTVY